VTKLFPVVTTFAITEAILAAEPVSAPQAPITRAWAILEQCVTNSSAEKRANAVHALRLLPNSARTQKMADSALADSNPKVRAASARALGPMGTGSSVPKLTAVLNDLGHARHGTAPGQCARRTGTGSPSESGRDGLNRPGMYGVSHFLEASPCNGLNAVRSSAAG
jgi:hypothetical protein